MQITASSYQANGLTFDARDHALALVAVTARESFQGPRVGDFVIMPGEDKPRRFTHNWGEDIQTSLKDSDGGAGFFLYGCGSVSFSGSLDHALLKSQLQPIASETRAGLFWFFHHGETRAHNAVYFMAPCRVFRFQPN